MSKDFVILARGTQSENGLDWVIQLYEETGKYEVIIGSDPESFHAVKFFSPRLLEVEAFLLGYQLGLGV